MPFSPSVSTVMAAASDKTVFVSLTTPPRRSERVTLDGDDENLKLTEDPPSDICWPFLKKESSSSFNKTSSNLEGSTILPKPTDATSEAITITATSSTIVKPLRLWAEKNFPPKSDAFPS